MPQNASRIYNELTKFGSQYSAWSDVRHLGVMVWMMMGMIATGSVNLTKWLSHINTKALIASQRLYPEKAPRRLLCSWNCSPPRSPRRVWTTDGKERAKPLVRTRRKDHRLVCARHECQGYPRAVARNVWCRGITNPYFQCYRCRNWWGKAKEKAMTAYCVVTTIVCITVMPSNDNFTIRI